MQTQGKNRSGPGWATWRSIAIDILFKWPRGSYTGKYSIGQGDELSLSSSLWWCAASSNWMHVEADYLTCDETRDIRKSKDRGLEAQE